MHFYKKKTKICDFWPFLLVICVKNGYFLKVSRVSSHILDKHSKMLIIQFTLKFSITSHFRKIHEYDDLKGNPQDSQV